MPEPFHQSALRLTCLLLGGLLPTAGRSGEEAPVGGAEPAPVWDPLIPAMEGDGEFGEQMVIERISNWDPWLFRASFYLNQTSNAELSEVGASDDAYFRSSIALNYAEVITGSWLVDAAFLQEGYRYDEFSDLDFDYLRGHAGLLYHLTGGRVPAVFHDGLVFANYAYYRVSDGLLRGSVFDNHSLAFGYQRSVPTRIGHRFYYGLTTDLSLEASVAEYQRNEYRAHAGYSIEWTEDLTVGASYVGGWFDYQNADQQDWNHLFELHVRQVLKRAEVFGQEGSLYLEFLADHTLNDAAGAFQDYEAFTWGAGLGFKISF